MVLSCTSTSNRGASAAQYSYVSLNQKECLRHKITHNTSVLMLIVSERAAARLDGPNGACEGLCKDRHESLVVHVFIALHSLRLVYTHSF